ncbi:MAG: tetratricopeptide repeat protein [Phycisphaerales bacterium]|nr:MAG: tetratricopeptide repeat protein [Phycisphaerales bacterium]
MMRVYMRLLLTVLVVVAGSSWVADADPAELTISEGRTREFKTERALGKAVISWLADGNAQAAIECDALVKSLLAEQEPSARSYFLAAQVANLRERPHDAISALESAIGRYPDEKAPVMSFPVRIVARFWIGTIARHSGDMQKAQSVYESILADPGDSEGRGNLMMMCNLYLAEIESEHLRRNDRAVTNLEAIERVGRPSGHWAMQYEMYKAWAQHRHAQIVRGKEQAAHELSPYPEVTLAPLLAVTQLKLSGIGASPLAGCCGRDERRDVIGETFSERVIQGRSSPIDEALVRLADGYMLEANKKYGEAENHYSRLFQNDSFLSPIAGISLARMKKAQGKISEAAAILEQVRAKYPGYDLLVTSLQQSLK